VAADPQGGGWTVTRGGTVAPVGGAPRLGDGAESGLAAPVVAIAATPDGAAYWLAGSDGGVFAFGDAHLYGSVPERNTGSVPERNTGSVPERNTGSASYTFFYLQPGATYEADVQLANDGRPYQDLLSGQVTITNPCPTGACVSVDATETIGAADRAAQGFLHGAYAGADEAYLAGLHATMFRGAVPYVNGQLHWSQLQAAEAAQVPITLVISDAWWAANGGHFPAPTSAVLATYREWLTSYISAVLASGHRVDYFEPYNEPDDPNYYGALVSSNVTADELYKPFLVAYKAIKGLDPQARVVGPSSSSWSERSDPSYLGGFNIADFLAFAAAHGIQLAAVSFHFFESTPLYLMDQVVQARQLSDSAPQNGPSAGVDQRIREPKP
jgi:hypothetical protein